MPLADAKPRIPSQSQGCQETPPSASQLPTSSSQDTHCQSCPEFRLLKDAGGVAMETEQQRSREEDCAGCGMGLPVLNSTAPPDAM